MGAQADPDRHRRAIETLERQLARESEKIATALSREARARQEASRRNAGSSPAVRLREAERQHRLALQAEKRRAELHRELARTQRALHRAEFRLRTEQMKAQKRGAPLAHRGRLFPLEDLPALFLSYAPEDEPLARRLTTALAARGFGVWVNERGPEGFPLSDVVVTSESADAALLLVTPTSLASPAMISEWTQALGSSRRVLPVLAHGAQSADLPPEIRHIDVADLEPDYNLGVEEIVQRVITAGVGQIRSDKRLTFFENASSELTDRLATAISEIDLAANSLDGLLRPAPNLLAAAARRGVRVRIVLPDPSYFSNATGGRLLELSSRAAAAIHRLVSVSESAVGLRLSRTVIPQMIVRIDDLAWVDPFPVVAQQQGLLAVANRGNTTHLFSTLAGEFEALYTSATEHPASSTSKPIPSKLDDVAHLFESGSASDLERAAQLYLRAIGYTPTVETRVEADAGYDLIAWGPKTGPTVVQVKRAANPIPRAAVEQLLQAATAAGAKAAILFTNKEPTSAARQAFERASESEGVELEIISAREALARIASAK